MAKFKPRLTQPSATDKYWIHHTAGGYNICIKVNHDWCLPNCVGYAHGRLLELIGQSKVNWSLPACNAEDWMERAIKNGLQTGKEPKLGAVICWAKGQVANGSDGAGHVAVVEEIKPNGDIVISQSGYRNYTGQYFSNFSTKTITKASGYAYSSGYTFRGFIYCPVEFEQTNAPATTVATQPTTPSASTSTNTSNALQFKVGDNIQFTGNTHYTSSYDTGKAKPAKPCKAKVTALSKGKPHPYHVIGNSVYGWVNASDIK